MWTMHFFHRKERIFVTIAGFKGLTTVILALIAYINLVTYDVVLANTILYSSLSLILISGIAQGLFLPFVTQRTGVAKQSKTADSNANSKIQRSVKKESKIL